MRIIAGKFKGISIYEPKDEKIRPLKDMVRESIFNFLVHSNKISFQIEQANVLDLYSGTGSFGLEFISREAQQVFFVEKEKDAVEILKKNISKLKGKNKSKVYFNDVIDIFKKNFFPWASDLKFDVIFCDPPFKESNINKLLESITKKNLLKKSGIIILHRHKNTNDQLIDCLNVIDERIYGLSKIIFAQIKIL